MAERTDEVARFLGTVKPGGCVEFSTVATLVEQNGLSDQATEKLYTELDRRHVDLADDCGHKLETVSVSTSDLAVATSDSVRLFLDEIGRYPLLTAEQEIALAKRVEQGDEQAREQMINANLRLVVSVAKRYQWSGLPLL